MECCCKRERNGREAGSDPRREAARHQWRDLQVRGSCGPIAKPRDESPRGSRGDAWLWPTHGEAGYLGQESGGLGHKLATFDLQAEGELHRSRIRTEKIRMIGLREIDRARPTRPGIQLVLRDCIKIVLTQGENPKDFFRIFAQCGFSLNRLRSSPGGSYSRRETDSHIGRMVDFTP